MQPADDVKKLIDESQITSSPEVDRRILADALADLEKRRVAGATNRPGAWRILMNSKWSKLAAAAVIVIAVLIALPFLSPFSSKVTFAQAIQPILNANTAIFDIVVGVEGPNTPVMHDMVIGSRIRRTLSNVPDNVSVIDLQAGRILTLEESKKEAAYINLEGLPSIPNYLDVLKNLLTKLQDNPRMVVEDLGMAEMEGREVVGFLARHPNLEVTVWADAKTGLPVRIEHREKQLLVIVKNMQFDVPMEESLFSMEVPAGYKQQEVDLDLFGSTEADFIEGLRVLAETVGDGQFPDGVALDDFLKQAPVIGKKIEDLQLSDEEKTALGVQLQKHIMFLRFFKGEGKWYYRGKGVQLGAADKPIFWYRPTASETYRVIYGDLHVEDVAPENLPEPLDADDVAAEASVGYQQWSKPDFVGTQDDLWQIQAGERMTVRSDLTLLKGPQGVSTMPITLPCATGILTSVTLAGSPVAFHATGPGQYELQLPLETLLAGQTKITCTWTLPLADLQVTEYGYQVPLRSLIPVVSLKLKASVDPDSGYEFGERMKSSQHPSEGWAPMCTWGGPEPKTDCGGTCGIAVQKRQ